MGSSQRYNSLLFIFLPRSRSLLLESKDNQADCAKMIIPTTVF